MEGIQRINGKIARKKIMYGNGVSLFVGYGRNWTAQNFMQVRSVANPRNEDPSEQQTAHREKFTATVQAVLQKKANPTEWEAVKEGFKNQSKYPTLWGYAFALVYPTVH